jgi:hypothetical protein
MKNESIRVGTELFRQAFMAVDYLEFRFIPKTNKRRINSEPTSNKMKTPQKSIRHGSSSLREFVMSDRGDVPGWVLVVLMTTGLVTAIWAVAAPRLNAILKNSLDSMNNIR